MSGIATSLPVREQSRHYRSTARSLAWVVNIPPFHLWVKPPRDGPSRQLTVLREMIGFASEWLMELDGRTTSRPQSASPVVTCDIKNIVGSML